MVTGVSTALRSDNEGSPKKPANGPANFWDRQYEAGHDFGDQPSLTVQILAERLQRSNSDLLDIGHGPNPRDTLELVRQGHRVLAIEESTVATQKAADIYDAFMQSATHDVGRADFLRGDFKRAQIAPAYYDGASCHRVIHLVNPKNVPAFVNAIARSMKPSGYLAIGARDPRDFNPEQMTLRQPGMAEIKERPGHIINFWDPNLFIRAFKFHFNIVAFDVGEEMESNMNPDLKTHFLVLTAQKKEKPSEKLIITEDAQEWMREHERDFEQQPHRPVQGAVARDATTQRAGLFASAGFGHRVFAI